MKKLLRFLTSKVTIVSFLALLQLIAFGLAVIILAENFTYFITFSRALSFVLVFIIYRGEEPETYKSAWAVPILLFPIFGGMFYLTFKPLNATRKRIEKFNISENKRKNWLKKEIKPLPKLESAYLKQMTFLEEDVWPFYENTELTFLPSGEKKLKHLLAELEQAKSYIFIEYFILEEGGETWGAIFPILKKKAAAGVDVRIIYDDWGSSLRLNRRFKKRMESHNIKVVIFNKMKLRFSVALNYRDHKKIVVIDGNVGFTGGINMADEYANIKKRFGHWHDSAIMLKGDAVYSLTISFLQTWDSYTGEVSNIKKYKPTNKMKSDGYVIPFTDSPFNKKLISKHLYLQMISAAKKEIYIATPYFIVDNDMINIIKTQATSGVKVHIAVPGIPDKRFAYNVTKYYLKQLVNTPNIFIYSYTPGFLHSKMLYIDDEVASIGTVNFDFRSFYLHFENSVWIYNSRVLKEVKSFFSDTLDKSKLLTYKDLHRRNPFYKIYETFLVLFSPML